MTYGAGADLASARRPLLGGAARTERGRWSRLVSMLSFSWVAPMLGGGVQLGHALRRTNGGLAAADVQLQRRLRRRNESLLRSLAAVFWPQLVRAAAYKLCADLVRYIPPLLLSRLLSSLQSASNTEVYLLAVTLPLITLTQALLVNQYFWHALRTGVQLRGVVATAVIKRSLRCGRPHSWQALRCCVRHASDMSAL